VVSRVVSFGAFVELDNGIEALLHVSQMGEPAPQAPEELVRPGERITAKIVSLEPDRQRMGLTLKPIDGSGEAQPVVEAQPAVEVDLDAVEEVEVEVTG
jgi:small subunit ribosomal protein S1